MNKLVDSYDPEQDDDERVEGVESVCLLTDQNHNHNQSMMSRREMPNLHLITSNSVRKQLNLFTL